MKVKEISTDIWYFWCPGCKGMHALRANKTQPNVQGPNWGFNGDVDKPTFTPSILVSTTDPETQQRTTLCHSFVVDGRIQFLMDCAHDLKGQTVELPEYPANDGFGEDDPNDDGVVE